MSNDAPWTIERIRDALADPDLVARFLAEINTAPAHQLLTVFAKWERIAKSIEESFDDTDVIVEAVRRGEDPPGVWIDGTERLQQIEEGIRSRGAA